MKAWVEPTNCENYSEKVGLTANSLIEEEIVCLTEDTPGDREKPHCLTADVLEGTQNSDNEFAQCKKWILVVIDNCS